MIKIHKQKFGGLVVKSLLLRAAETLTDGALFIMIGQEERGFTRFMNSSLGYVLVQMSPLFLKSLSWIRSAI